MFFKNAFFSLGQRRISTINIYPKKNGGRPRRPTTTTTTRHRPRPTLTAAKPRFLSSYIATTTTRSSSSSRPSPSLTIAECVRQNQHQREELAAAYQVLQHFGLSEGIHNHLSTRAPARNGNGEVMLVFPFGLHWSEVTASSLVGVDLEDDSIVEGCGQPEATAIGIHCEVHRALLRTGSSMNSVFHVHPPYASALSCLKDPTLRMIHQNSTMFFKDVAYDNAYDGLANTSSEGARIAKQMGGKSVLLMGNHGILVTGKSVACAFNSTYYLERAAMAQILAMSSGEELVELDDEISSAAYKTMMDAWLQDSKIFFEAMKRVIKNKNPPNFTE